jgi:hypothetical protein
MEKKRGDQETAGDYFHPYKTIFLIGEGTEKHPSKETRTFFVQRESAFDS